MGKGTEAQGVQKAILETTKESKEFNMVKKADMQDGSTKRFENKLKKNCKYYGTVHEPTDIQHMEGAVQDVDELITLNEFAKMKVGR